MLLNGLATADIGISMGISGSALANKTGHVILMSNDIRKIQVAVKLARKATRKIFENIFISVITKVAIIALAIAGHPFVWAAVLADVGTCLLDKYETLFFIVDLYALTLPYDVQQLSKATRDTAALYLACGVDTSKASVFVQSHVRAHVELMWLLGSAAPIGWLNRMIQFKEKSQKASDENVGVALLTYPVLMASDILLYQHPMVGCIIEGVSWCCLEFQGMFRAVCFVGLYVWFWVHVSESSSSSIKKRIVSGVQPTGSTEDQLNKATEARSVCQTLLKHLSGSSDMGASFFSQNISSLRQLELEVWAMGREAAGLKASSTLICEVERLNIMRLERKEAEDALNKKWKKIQEFDARKLELESIYDALIKAITDTAAFWSRIPSSAREHASNTIFPACTCVANIANGTKGH